MNTDNVYFSWCGIKKTQGINSKSISTNLLNQLIKLLAPETLELLGIEKEKENETTNGLPNWDIFRILINYFIECVQQEAGAAADHFDEAEGEQFVYLSQHGDWMPRHKKPYIGFIPPLANHANFIKRLANLDPGTPFVLGYPTEIWNLPKTHEDIPRSAKVRPIFQFKLSYDPRRRCFFSNDPIPEVNSTWLKSRVANTDLKCAFLKSCGFLDANEEAENIIGGSPLSLFHLISTLSELFPHFIREPLISSSIPDSSLKGVESGIYNRSVLMLAKPGRYVKTLISELKYIVERPEEELRQTALGHLFLNDSGGKKHTSPKPKQHSSVVMDTLRLNLRQRHAVSSLLQSNISVVTGPPGTGKSQVAAATMANMRLRGKSVLFASKNHKAIDAVMGRLQVEDGTPYVVRANSKDDPNLKINFQKIIRLLLEGNYHSESKQQSDELMEQIERLLIIRGKRNDIIKEIEQLKSKIENYEEEAAFHSLNISEELCHTIEKKSGDLPQGLLEHIETVLENLQKDASFFVTSYGYIKFWLLKLKIILLHRIPGFPALCWFPWKDDFASIKENQITFQKIKYYSKALEHSNKLAAKLRLLPNYEDLSKEIFELSEKIQKLVQKTLPLNLKAKGSGVPTGEERSNLANLKASLRFLYSGMLNRRDEQSLLEKSKKDIQILLNHAPCWAVTNLSVGSRFPLVPGMFDLTIIDEASQCDMVSAIPILYRAKRAGVIGDPCQLRHIANIGSYQDVLIRQQVGLSEYTLNRFSYKETSLYDLFTEITNVTPVFLNETYRSHIEIAQYSNESFYDNKLRVAVDPSQLSIPKGRSPGLHWTPVKSEILSGGPSGCYSIKECEFIVQNIYELLETGFRGSIGVVTPFRQQANRINDALYDRGISQDLIQETGLHIDTSHGFQGDERDIMYFSLCGGPDMPQGSFNFLQKQGNLFNVAASRARAILHVVGNRDWAANCGIQHIERLAAARVKNENLKAEGPWAPHDSPWEKVLYQALIIKGLEPIIQYPVAGRKLDLALIHPSLKLDIEVDGDRYHRNPDGSRKQDDLWRDYQLKSLGWQIKRYWVYQLREDLESCVNSILTIWRDKDDNL